MATDLQTVQSNTLPTPCSRLCSNPALLKLVDDFQPGIGQRLATKPERAELARLQAEYEQTLTPATPAQIKSGIGMLALAYPALKVSPDEAKARLELYAQALGDLPHDILNVALMKALKELTFFPSVSEIRERATGFAQRVFRYNRVKQLIAKHDSEYREPEPERELSAEDHAEMARLRKKFGLDAQ